MKKASISPVTSLLLSLSLALGILVGNMSDYGLLATAHAQESTCDGTGDQEAVVSDSVNIEDGLILGGLTVRNLTVNGSLLEQAVIAGDVKLSDAQVVGSHSLVQTDGVIVGSGGAPCTDGVIVGSGNAPSTDGVIVGSGNATISGMTGDGGALTGDDIMIVNGVITGQNLLLSGATFSDGSVSGTIRAVSITLND